MAIDQQTRSEILRLHRADVSTALAAIATVIAAFIVDLRRREGIPEESTRFHGYIARHFLIWLEHAGIDLKTVDGEVIGRFLRHDCHCAAFCAPLRVWRWRKRRTSPELMRFIRHLERTGQIETPGELDDNLRLLDVFLAGLRDEGHTEETVKSYRRSCTGLVVWLHLSRIRLCDLTPEVHARFRERRFACSIPGVFRGRQSQKPGAGREGERRRFLDYLAETGRIAPLEPTPRKRAQPVRLAGFAVWLERHRGISRKTIRRHVRRIEVMLPELGDDPGTYDAALIRRVLLERMQPWSRGHARSLTSTMRMYLRFLASEGAIPGALVAAAPSVPQYQLSTLPRYIPPEDIERVIAGCGDDPMGVRDRAILLLLARLALRAGDIVALRLGDIDWDRAEIRVTGKSRREAVLPLPQDVGDALHDYIARVRPGVDEERVFLRVIAPFRAFDTSTAISSMVKRALDRAGVETAAGRGAHLFRHSRATELLRSGASLDVIQALLRHASPSTTMIYAKTDVVMLREVAQPWIGGTGQ